MHRRLDLSRGAFLRLGASALAGSAVTAGTALGAPTPPAPQGDDLGFLAFGAVGERASLTFYRTALKTPGLFNAAERRSLDAARATKRTHIAKINAVLGEDAVSGAVVELGDGGQRAVGTRVISDRLGDRML